MREVRVESISVSVRVPQSPMEQAMSRYLLERRSPEPMPYTEVLNSGPLRPYEDDAFERFCTWNRIPPDPAYVAMWRGYGNMGPERKQP